MKTRPSATARFLLIRAAVTTRLSVIARFLTTVATSTRLLAGLPSIATQPALPTRPTANQRSRRFKEEIKPIDRTSETLFALKPVTFRYKKEIDPKGISQFGLVAEEVEKVNPDLVVRDKEGKPYSVRYDQVNAMLLNEFLKAHRRMEKQDKRIEELTAQLKQQAVQIQKVGAQLAAASPSRGGLEASKTAPQVVNNP
jgi:hypothetical protein